MVAHSPSGEPRLPSVIQNFLGLLTAEIDNRQQLFKRYLLLAQMPVGCLLQEAFPDPSSGLCWALESLDSTPHNPGQHSKPAP